jgi:Cys-rich protein (TIGR01571 family)
MAGDHDKKAGAGDKKVDASGIAVGRWDVGFCGCFTHCVPNCLMVWCLPCVSLAQISSRLGVAKFGRALLFYLFGIVLLLGLGGVSNFLLVQHIRKTNEAVGNDDYVYVNDLATSDLPVTVYIIQVVADLIALCLFVSVWQLRSKTRERFDIPGNCCADCCSVLCCSLCAITQMATHVKSYKPGNCNFGPVDTLPAYTK